MLLNGDHTDLFDNTVNIWKQRTDSENYNHEDSVAQLVNSDTARLTEVKSAQVIIRLFSVYFTHWVYHFLNCVNIFYCVFSSPSTFWTQVASNEVKN